MDKLSQTSKNPNDISQKLQILKGLLLNNDEKEFSEYKKDKS